MLTAFISEQFLHQFVYCPFTLSSDCHLYSNTISSSRTSRVRAVPLRYGQGTMFQLSRSFPHDARLDM